MQTTFSITIRMNGNHWQFFRRFFLPADAVARRAGRAIDFLVGSAPIERGITRTQAAERFFGRPALGTWRGDGRGRVVRFRAMGAECMTA